MKPSIFLYSLLLVISLLTGGCVTFTPVAQPVVTGDLEAAPETVVVRPVCKERPQRKVLVTAFPLRYPEQLKSGEFMDWAPMTGVALGGTLERNAYVRAVSAVSQFPFVSAGLAPELEQKNGVPLISEWSARAGAQYVVSGVFQDFGVSKWAMTIPGRHLKVEAFIFDALSGKRIARKEFVQKLLGSDIPRNVLLGSDEFEATRLGATYKELIVDMANWVEDTVTCQPFPVKVARVEGDKVYLDMGSDHDISVGMTLQSWRPGAAPPPRHPGAPASVRQLPTAVVKQVQANGSVAEIPRQRFPPTVKPGDILYVSNGV